MLDMAALAIPILSAAMPLLMPVISKLVTEAERLFGAKTGPTKFDSVLQAITPIATQLATAGKIPGTLDAVSIGAMIETAVQALKSAGLLGGPALPQGSGLQPGTYAVSGSLKIG